MIDTGELLSMMTARGIQIGHIPGALPRLTGLDVAGAMGIAHVPTYAQMLVLARLCLDVSAKHEAWAFWFEDRMQHYRAAWRTWKPGQMRALVDHTLEEYLSANTCGLCGGAGSHMIGSRKVDCGRCSGVGRMYTSERALARLFCCDRRQIGTIWAPRIAESRGTLQRWEYQALVGLAHGLGIRA
jgi:hypothetical protein